MSAFASNGDGCLPLLRWAGSKKRQFSAISRLFPRSYETYVEPFAGSAAFAFCLGETRARLNDLNRDLVSFYLEARQDSKDFYNEFRSIPRTEKAYYKNRDIFNKSKQSREKSILFYYLNRNCFNGIHRLNKAGEFNVPFSNSRVSPYLKEEEFIRSVKLISDAKIKNLDFEEFCRKEVKENDFVFIDPPYYSEERIFNEYNKSPFTLSDFNRLSDTLAYLNEIGAQFLLSYPQNLLSNRLARRWRSVRMPVFRTVAGDISKRNIVQELLIYNYDRRSA